MEQTTLSMWRRVVISVFGFQLACGACVQKLSGKAKLEDSKATKQIVALLSAPLEKYNDIVTALKLSNYPRVMDHLDNGTNKVMAVVIIQSIMKNTTCISTADKVEALFELIKGLIKDMDRTPTAELDEEDFKEEQNSVARLIPMLYNEDPEEMMMIICTVRKHILQGGPTRLPFTVPPLVFSALKIKIKGSIFQFKANNTAVERTLPLFFKNRILLGYLLVRHRRTTTLFKENSDSNIQEKNDLSRMILKKEYELKLNKVLYKDYQDRVIGEFSGIDMDLFNCQFQEPALKRGSDFRRLQSQDGDVAGEDGPVTPKKIFQLLNQTIEALSFVPSPELALRLYLQCAEAANDCDLEPVAYEFFTQAFILYEEEIADSKSQVTAIHLIIGTLQRMSIFGVENRDTLTHKATGYSAKLLKKPDQCRAVYACSHLFWVDEQDGIKDGESAKIRRTKLGIRVQPGRVILVGG
ncbi:hypothetical protein ACLOJK_034185 [Asimina triloba]